MDQRHFGSINTLVFTNHVPIRQGADAGRKDRAGDVGRPTLEKSRGTGDPLASTFRREKEIGVEAHR